MPSLRRLQVAVVCRHVGTDERGVGRQGRDHEPGTIEQAADSTAKPDHDSVEFQRQPLAPGQELFSALGLASGLLGQIRRLKLETIWALVCSCVTTIPKAITPSTAMSANATRPRRAREVLAWVRIDCLLIHGTHSRPHRHKWAST
jgi:hypothetical protein